MSFFNFGFVIIFFLFKPEILFLNFDPILLSSYLMNLNFLCNKIDFSAKIDNNFSLFFLSVNKIIF